MRPLPPLMAEMIRESTGRFAHEDLSPSSGSTEVKTMPTTSATESRDELPSLESLYRQFNSALEAARIAKQRAESTRGDSTGPSSRTELVARLSELEKMKASVQNVMKENFPVGVPSSMDYGSVECTHKRTLS